MNIPPRQAVPVRGESLTHDKYVDIHSIPSCTRAYVADSCHRRLIEMRKDWREERVLKLRDRIAASQTAKAAPVSATALLESAAAAKVEAVATPVVAVVKEMPKPIAYVPPIIVKKADRQEGAAGAAAVDPDYKEPPKKSDEKRPVKPSAVAGSAAAPTLKHISKKTAKAVLIQQPAAGAVVSSDPLMKKIADHCVLLSKLNPDNSGALLEEAREIGARYLQQSKLSGLTDAALKVFERQLDAELLEQTKRLIHSVPAFNQIIKASLRTACSDLQGIIDDAQDGIKQRIQQHRDERLDNLYDM